MAGILRHSPFASHTRGSHDGGLPSPGLDPGPFVSGFAAWLDTGHGAERARMRHLHHVKEFLVWCDDHPPDDVVSAARQFAESATTGQAVSMRLLLQWLADR